MKIVKSVNELVQYLKSSLNLKKGDTIELVGPQFERDWPIEIDFIPKSEEELKALIETAPEEILKKMGVAVWAVYDPEDPDDYLKPGEKHYLFPKEWYNHIPAGFEVISIMGNKKKFKPGITDDDQRFGCLCYGFVRNF